MRISLTNIINKIFFNNDDINIDIFSAVDIFNANLKICEKKFSLAD